jgi:hypothetical protein
MQSSFLPQHDNLAGTCDTSQEQQTQTHIDTLMVHRFLPGQVTQVYLSLGIGLKYLLMILKSSELATE